MDVPGDALSCVFIDKLPFPEMNDPVMGVLQERYDDWFNRFSMPSAIMALRQGFGRLIRGSKDRGVVVVCDPRLFTKGYGKKFIASLPKTKQSRKLADIQAFLGTVPMTLSEGRPNSLDDDAVPF